jgi:hypothetical protein
VFISSCQNSEIHGNTLEADFRAITCFLDCGTMVGRTIDLHKHRAHDNTIRVGKQSGAFAIGMSYTSDCTSTQLTTYHGGAKNLRFSHTRRRAGRRRLIQALDGITQWFPWDSFGRDPHGVVTQLFRRTADSNEGASRPSAPVKNVDAELTSRYRSTNR